MKTTQIALLLGLTMASTMVSAVTMGASNPTFTRLLYKGHPSMPTVPNTSIVNSAINAGATYTLGAVSSFKGAFTPVNVGMTLGTTLIAYGMMTALNELRIQAGANVPQYTDPAPSVAVDTSSDSWYFNQSPFGWANCLQSSLTLSGSGSSICAGYQSKVNACFAANNTPSPPTYTWNASAKSCSSSAYTLPLVNTAPAACPSGYTAQADGCVQIGGVPVPYPSDGKPSWNIKFGADGTPQFVPDPRDPDVATDPPQLEGVGQDQYGNPVSERVTPNKNGGITIVRETQSEHPTTHQPMTQRDVVATDSFGTVVQSTSTVYDNSQVTNVSNNIDTSMLAQEATQQQIKTLLDPQTPPDLATVDQPVLDARTSFLQGVTGAQTTLDSNPASTVSPVAYWTYASGTCYPMEFDAGRLGIISLNRFCWIYDTYIKAVIIWVFGVWGMWHAFRYWAQTVKEM